MFNRSGMWTWLLQRITAVMILVGLVFHFVYLHWFIERPVTKAKVFQVMGSPGWIIFDTILMVAALYHLGYGVYGIVVDFNPSDGFKKAFAYFLWIFGIALGVFGVVTLVAMRQFGGVS